MSNHKLSNKETEHFDHENKNKALSLSHSILYFKDLTSFKKFFKDLAGFKGQTGDYTDKNSTLFEFVEHSGLLSEEENIRKKKRIKDNQEFIEYQFFIENSKFFEPNLIITLPKESILFELNQGSLNKEMFLTIKGSVEFKNIKDVNICLSGNIIFENGLTLNRVKNLQKLERTVKINHSLQIDSCLNLSSVDCLIGNKDELLEFVDIKNCPRLEEIPKQIYSKEVNIRNCRRLKDKTTYYTKPPPRKQQDTTINVSHKKNALDQTLKEIQPYLQKFEIEYTNPDPSKEKNMRNTANFLIHLKTENSLGFTSPTTSSPQIEIDMLLEALIC